MAINPNGVVLYEGPSKMDGAPIVVIATGLVSKSTNSKTGGMVQTYILRSDMPPAEAIATGADASICGTCPHRGDGTGKGRSCYVVIFQGPRGVYEAYKRGSYRKVDAFEAQELFADRVVRLGAYGDPAAAPIAMWAVAMKRVKARTGYTHAWKNIPPLWATLVMASVDSEAEMREAQAKGYRTFRVSATPFDVVPRLEFICPASKERGQVITCEACRACGGTSSKAKASVVIAAHGSGKKHVTA